MTAETPREFKIYAYYKGGRYECGIFPAESAIAAMIDAKRECLDSAATALRCQPGLVNFEIEEDFL